jgi:formylmethanofuran dehydrogenase subunit C
MVNGQTNSSRPITGKSPGIIKGKEQRTQVVKQAKQMEFLNSYDKKVSQVDLKGGTIVVDGNVDVADGVLMKDKLHVSKVLSLIQICIVLGLFIWWLFIMLL